MTIAPFGPGHVDAVARLHARTLTGLLSSLGLRAVRAWYAGAAQAPSARGFVAEEEGALAGFVMGTTRPADLRREIVRANRIGVLASVVSGILSRPSVLPWLLGLRGGGADRPFDAASPELIYLAVSPDRRGGGAGRRLVDAFTTAMKADRATSYELSVDDDNAGAIAFYERLGFRETGRYREFGVAHRRYRMVIP